MLFDCVSLETVLGLEVQHLLQTRMLHLRAAISLSLLVVGCTSPTARYLDDAVCVRTQSEVKNALGNPAKEYTTNTGETLWLYQVKYRYKAALQCSGYKLRFDNQQVLQQWNNVSCSEEVTHDDLPNRNEYCHQGVRAMNPKNQ